MSYAHKKILNKQLPSYVGFSVMLVTLAVIIFLSGNTFTIISKATVGSEPKNIQISNITDTSFTVSYTTGASVIGTISYGTSPNTPDIALDDRDKQANNTNNHQVHFITVTNLTPSTRYYYVIDSGSQKVENNGSPYEITTSPPSITTNNAIQQTMSGTVSLNDGSIPTEGIVYVTADNSQQLATLIKPDGSYQIPLSNLRSSTLSDYATLSPESILQVHIVSPTAQSNAKVLLSAAANVPKIVLQQNYDFTLDTTALSSVSAENAPGGGFPAFTTPEPVSSPEITTPKNSQAFNDQQPLFQGLALPNTEVDITIQSKQEILVKLSSDNSGSWQYRPAMALAPGKHTITIQSVNASGIMQKLQRSFTVYASGSKFVEPSISPPPNSHPTATPKPTVAPTATPSPTPKPITPNPTAVPTSIPVSPTHAPVPKTGSSAVMDGLFAASTVIGLGALLIILSVV